MSNIDRDTMRELEQGGFENALIAVNNAAITYPEVEYRAVQRAIKAARASREAERDD